MATSGSNADDNVEEWSVEDMHKRVQKKLAAKAIFGDKLVDFLHF